MVALLSIFGGQCPKQIRHFRLSYWRSQHHRYNPIQPHLQLCAQSTKRERWIYLFWNQCNHWLIQLSWCLCFHKCNTFIPHSTGIPYRNHASCSLYISCYFRPPTSILDVFIPTRRSTQNPLKSTTKFLLYSRLVQNRKYRYQACSLSLMQIRASFISSQK